jgi:hypothetical protein
MMETHHSRQIMGNFFTYDKSLKWPDLILPVRKQLRNWRKANRKRKWRITHAEFKRIPPKPELTKDDISDGFVGTILSYGLGNDGNDNADAVLSGKLAWAHACRRWLIKTWQCQYIDFDKSDYIRLRPAAPLRPRGFYYTKFKPGDLYISWKVSRFLKELDDKDTGCGPEGLQLLTVTHPHIANLMNKRKTPFMAFCDYDVAPHGFNDFYDSVQMFCSNDTLGLGIGNVDQNYPLFGIPTLRF